MIVSGHFSLVAFGGRGSSCRDKMRIPVNRPISPAVSHYTVVVATGNTSKSLRNDLVSEGETNWERQRPPGERVRWDVWLVILSVLQFAVGGPARPTLTPSSALPTTCLPHFVPLSILAGFSPDPDTPSAYRPALVSSTCW